MGWEYRPKTVSDTILPGNLQETFQKIVDSRKRKGKREYLVKWKGYSSRENTYEPAANLPKELIEAFKKKK